MVLNTNEKNDHYASDVVDAKNDDDDDDDDDDDEPKSGVRDTFLDGKE